MKSVLMAFGVAAVAAALGTAALAQPGPKFLPSPETIAHADSFNPPKVGDYAAKLAQQPDFMGQWAPMEPPNAGVGPTFDPSHAYYPAQPPPGEALFGPVPGTYIKDIPYNPEWQKKYQALIKETTEGKSRDDFPACFPYGVPRMIGDTPVPFDVIQSPEVMLWYNFYGRTERRIFMDGRKHPATVGLSETAKTYSGHSVGHWEGNTLVIDTANMMGGYFDETPAPFSDQLHMVERLRLIDTNIMENQMTFTDPAALSAPWVVTRYYRRVAAPGPVPNETALHNQPIVHRFYDLVDQPCVPNVKMDKDGFQVAILPQELAAQSEPAKTPVKAKTKPAKKSAPKGTQP